MILISVHSKNQLLTAILVKQYFYVTTPVDIVIWDSFPDSKTLFHRVDNSTIFNQVHYAEVGKPLPTGMKYKWYRELILGVSSATRVQILHATLLSNNPYISLAFFEDSPDIYTATSMQANKVFVFRKELFNLPISTYEIPAILTSGTVDMCNYIFGYMRDSVLTKYNVLFVTSKHKYSKKEANIVNKVLGSAHPKFLISIEGQEFHRFVGQNINVIQSDFPLALLCANGDMEHKKILLYEPLAVENFSLLLSSGAEFGIYLGVDEDKSSPHYQSVLRIFDNKSNVTFINDMSRLLSAMEEI